MISPPQKACNLVLFGTKGDLACRKLIPALYQLEKANLLVSDVRVIGVARDSLSIADFVLFIEQCLNKFLKEPLVDSAWQRLQQKLHYVNIDLTHIQAYDKLAKVISVSSNTNIYYFATPPKLFGQISDGLAQAQLINADARVVLEKPIGHDLPSSVAINNQIARYFNEYQIYRIDHYLGKETVLNLIALRFANAIFSAHWDYQVIDHVQISVAEEVGVEGRWHYYNEAGQLRDMVQNHLLQVLSLIAMEPPVSLEADSIRDEKVKVLKALRPITPDNVQTHTVRAQYRSGFVGGKIVPGYLEEDQALVDSKTETFVALKVHIDNWRWAGVPFYLRTGKRMLKKQSEVVIYFKPQAHNIFHQTDKNLPANKLIIRLQPDEGIAIQIINKIPGLGETMQLQQSELNLSFDKTFQSRRIADAYERLLLEVILGHQYLFVRRDEVEQAWVWVDSIHHAWQAGQGPLYAYQSGSLGPTAATSLVARDYRNWED